MKILHKNCELQVAIRCVETGIWGAYKNIMINLDDVINDKTKQEIAAKARKLLETSETMSSRLLAALEK
jgi:glutamate formiminotransferase/formiminotetrahydrofolate cyclodeaminase